jgi:hypothetical protein
MSTSPSEERKFLHDISSPVSTGLFLIDSIIDSLKLNSALQKMKDLIKSRRDLLISRDEAKLPGS